MDQNMNKTEIIQNTKTLLHQNNEIHIYNQFINIYNQAITKSNTKHIPNKYISTQGLHRKLYGYYKLIKHAKQHNKQIGLDFGCAMSTPSVIAKLLNMHIVGIDIDQYNLTTPSPEFNTNKTNIELPYLDLINNLKQQENLQIDIFNTNAYPWKYQDNTYEFIIASWALHKNMKPQKGLIETTNNAQRINELLRISKPNSIWYIAPHQHITLLQQTKTYQQKTKNINIYNLVELTPT